MISQPSSPNSPKYSTSVPKISSWVRPNSRLSHPHESHWPSHPVDLAPTLSWWKNMPFQSQSTRNKIKSRRYSIIGILLPCVVQLSRASTMMSSSSRRSRIEKGHWMSWGVTKHHKTCCRRYLANLQPIWRSHLSFRGGENWRSCRFWTEG